MMVIPTNNGRGGWAVKKILVSVIAAVFLLFGWNGTGQAEQSKDKKPPERVIVKLKTSLKTFGFKETNSLEIKDKPSQPLITVDVPEDRDTKDFIKELENRKDVEYAEVDHLIKLQFKPNDPSFHKQWFHQTIESERAWDKTMGSKDVVVAVIDDGVDVNHQDLKANIVSPYDVLTGQSKVPPGEHGTHVAGIIGSTAHNNLGVAGVAPKSKIMPINVFDGDYAYTFDVAEGVYHAVYAGADIINMSLGSYQYSYALDDAIQYAYDMGVVVVASAGNDDTYLSSYPASYDHVISVSATEQNDEITDFSNYGYDIDLAAPGRAIFSTLPGNRYGAMDGTSMAAPIVSGTAALVLSTNLNLSNDDVVQKLYDTADWYGSDYRIFHGEGRVNARRAVGLKKYVPAPSITKSFYDHSTSLEGKISFNKKGKVEVKVGKVVIGKGNVSSNGQFSVVLPKQKSGTAMSVEVIYDDEISKIATVKVLDGKPNVNKVGDNDSKVTGKAEAGSTVTVKAGSKKLGSSVAASNGTYSVKISKQKAGTKLTVTATDKAKNVSKGNTVTVVDNTPPKAPSVNPVSPKATKVTGKAEGNSTVTVKAGKTKLGSAKADKKGSYSVTIKKQKKGTKLSVTATDQAKNTSKASNVTVK